MNRSFFAKLFASAAMLVPAVAAAQTADSGEIDAVATLQVVTPPLTVTGATSLNFGTVNIPNGAGPAGNTCSYALGANRTLTVAERDSAGNFVDQVLPTPSQCEGNVDFAPGKFEIECSAATTTTITVELTNGGQPGLLLGETGNDLFISNRGATFAFLTSGQPTASPICPDGTASGSTAGQMDVYVGAQLIVEENAVPGSNVNVGTITLSAVY